jgi:hypothetical protein
MSIPVIQLEPETPQTTIKDYISLFSLIFGSIFISIGSFLEWGLPIGFVVVGVLMLYISVMFGLKG